MRVGSFAVSVITSSTSRFLLAYLVQSKLHALLKVVFRFWSALNGVVFFWGSCCSSCEMSQKFYDVFLNLVARCCDEICSTKIKSLLGACQPMMRFCFLFLVSLVVVVVVGV